jgi:allophanate hydrolase subunit 1
MYLGLDTWQSPNGFDVIGTVIYHLFEGKTKEFSLEAIPLDFVRLKERHTSVYLSEVVCVEGVSS